ncbi:MAG: hypothetical protein A3K09_02225 [Nitrospinae bacterium RIFCSPLOWO2_12_FULL_47_7]|nr:MAG: hypothetical protein A3K09_02225 [Nitrospinae bacterium RIFCSPLOWO2_12_FULL_47_7]
MKAKILVADDSVTIQKIVAMSFENEDIGVVGVNNGKQAFEKMYEVRPDIVLADTDMPGLTGYQLSKKIKESKEFSSVKVLLLTSDFEDFNQALYESCKADGRISKPFKSDEIIKRVNELLGASGSQEEPELLSLSAIDIVDEGDLPQAILLEEDSIVTTPDNKVEDVPHTPQAKTEDEFDFDDIFKDTFETSTDMTPAPESANLGGGKLAGEQGFDETATLASMVQEIESMDWLDESPKEEANLAGNTTSQLEETRDSSILDKMVEDLENLTRPEMEMSVEAKAGAFEDIEFEISNAKVESPDELDKAFNQLKSSKPAPAVRQSGVPPKVEKEQAAKPTIKNLEPEPDDLLEKLAPSAF